MTDDEYIKAALKTLEKNMNRHARDVTDHFNNASRMFENDFFESGYNNNNKFKKTAQTSIYKTSMEIDANSYPELLDALHAILNDEIKALSKKHAAATARPAPKPQEPFESDPLWTPTQSDRKMTAATQKTKINAVATAEEKRKKAEDALKNPPRPGMCIVI